MDTYVIRCTETGRFKIGQSGDVARRFKDIRTMCATKVELYAILDATECEIHRMLAGHRMHGEWFAPNAQVIAVINDWTALSGADYWRMCEIDGWILDAERAFRLRAA